MKLNERAFLIYKLSNSSFTGLSIGILFTIYQPIEDPAIYSLGGMILAIGMLILAKFYDKILNITSFYRISLFVEIIIMLSIFTFLLLKYSLTSALIIYCSYQLTFIFGGYLVRAETLVAKNKKHQSWKGVWGDLGVFPYGSPWPRTLSLRTLILECLCWVL